LLLWYLVWMAASWVVLGVGISFDVIWFMGWKLGGEPYLLVREVTAWARAATTGSSSSLV